MSDHSTGSFQVKSWDEQPVEHVEGHAKVTRASVTQTFTGVIDGEATMDYLMVYPTDTYASVVGLARVSGTVDGRRGTFVLQSTGTWENGVAKGTFTVVPHSATGELRGLAGEGTTVSQEAAAGSFTFEYRFE